MSERILILEDEVIVAWDIEAELQSRGQTVVGVVGSVADTLALIEAGGITLAILDINIKRENSYEAARLCREKGVRVIFLTGYSGASRPDDLADFVIIPKPVSYNQLMNAVLGVLESNSKLSE